MTKIKPIFEKSNSYDINRVITGLEVLFSLPLDENVNENQNETNVILTTN